MQRHYRTPQISPIAVAGEVVSTHVVAVFQGSKCSSGWGIGGLGWSHVRERTVSHEAWIGCGGRLVGRGRGTGAGRVLLLDGAEEHAAHGLGDHVDDQRVAGGQRQGEGAAGGRRDPRGHRVPVSYTHLTLPTKRIV